MLEMQFKIDSPPLFKALQQYNILPILNNHLQTIPEWKHFFHDQQVTF